MPATVPSQSQAPPPLLLLLRIHLRTAWRRLRAIGHHSRLLTAVIATFIASYLVLAFLLFFTGLRFIEKFPGLGTLLSERLMFLLFFFLFVLLMLSNMVVSYSNLFRNRESTYLMSLPIPTHTIFQWKLLESAALASWAFLFLIAPLVAAFGITRQVPWHFYPVTTAVVALFIILPAVIGAYLAVQTARYMDRRLFQILVVAALLLVILATCVLLRPEPIPEDLQETRVLAVLDKLLTKTRFSMHPLLPSHWLTSSILLWSEGAVRGAMFYILLLFSYVMFFGGLAFSCMGGRFYAASSAVQSRGAILGRWGWFQARQKRRRRHHDYGPGFFDRCLSLIPGLTSATRALMIKDARMFWRDTSQWAQSLVLFGLLAVYIFNLRHFTQQLTNPFWVHLVSYLNLGACSLNLATLTTRFVYPQFSLEGKRLWIVGMTPLGLPRILSIKFWLAAVTAEIVTLSLISLSCYMLQLPFLQGVLFACAITIMTLTLTGLAVGLGALYPNFKEENPSKIVSGFGGTFCLVLSFIYILAAVILLAMATPWGSTRALLCYSSFLGLSILLGWIPYRLGLRRVRQFEI